MNEKWLQVKWGVIIRNKEKRSQWDYLQVYAHKSESLGEMHSFLESVCYDWLKGKSDQVCLI